MKTYIGISRDHSGSMSNISRAAAEDFNQLIESIRINSGKNKIDTSVSIVKCGVGYSGLNIFETHKKNIFDIKKIQSEEYITDGRQTPLFDSVGMLIEEFQSVPDYNDPTVNFLIMVVTDGLDNASKKWIRNIGNKIKELQATDRWTFTFRVPKGYDRQLINKFNIPEGNILEWEQTQEGMIESSVKTDAGLRSFFDSKKSGQQSTFSFYKTDMFGVSANQVKTALVDISNDVEIWNVTLADDKKQIRTFCEEHLNRPMKRGSAFYLLMKTEDEVQDYKQIVIRNKKTKAIYSGANARQLLGLPYSGTVRIVPGNHGTFDIFIQSTSVNRKLVKGTQVLYWDAVGQEYLTNKSFPGPKPIVTKPITIKSTNIQTTSIKSQEYISGYKEGFYDGKNKLPRQQYRTHDYINGYNDGYRDGRGKKKNLYK